MPPKERWVVRDFSDLDIMADELKKLKNLRRNKLSAFTRKQKHLQSLVDGQSDKDKLVEVLAELKEALKVLEEAHDNYSAVVDESILDEEGDYLEVPTNLLNGLDLAVSEKVKELDSSIEKAAEIEKLESLKLKVKNGMENFGKPSNLLSQLSSDKKISANDMKKEIEKVESSYATLLQDKMELLNIRDSGDLQSLVEQFENTVVAEVARCKLVSLEYIKENAEVAPSMVEDSTRPSSSSYSSTKRETVMLPHFSGDEKTSYLKYPVWKSQWDEHIKEYEVRYRSTMLMNHLDEKAQQQIVGLETNYEAAMNQLDTYFGDPKKIIRACLEEIRTQPQINPFDYKGLVQFKKCLINNHARLKASGLEHEMSNSATMGVLLKKFPIQEAVDYQKYLSEQEKADQCRPFPFFIKWLEKAGASWELLAASGTGIKGKSGSQQVHHTFYGEEDDGSTNKNKRVCFKCGQEGHIRKDCTKKDIKSTGGGKGQNASPARRAPRSPPKHRKHHCAYHKDTPDRYCVTWSCPSVKYTPYSDRVKLLKENLDCETCAGDCPKNNCLAKTKRVCGGGKEGRGCGTNHIGHELWCPNAKLCFTVSQETVLRSADENEDAVLLQVMKIPSIDGSAPFETALWDTACTGLFVRSEHAQQKGFSSKVPFCSQRGLL